MADKTIEQLQAEIDLDARLEKERKANKEDSDKSYSIKLVEKIFMWLTITAAGAVIVKLSDILISHFK